MGVFSWMLITLFVVLIIILVVKIKVCIHARNDSVVCEIKVLGFVFKVGNNTSGNKKPQKRQKDKTENKLAKLRQRRENTKKNDTKPKENVSVSERIYKIRHLIYTFRTVIDRTLRYLSTHITISKMVVKIKFGTGDAASTGIEYGLLWGITGSMLAILSSYLQLYEPDVEIVPDFNNKVFDFYVESIIETRIVHIIFAGVLALVTYLRYKRSGVEC